MTIGKWDFIKNGILQNSQLFGRRTASVCGKSEKETDAQRISEGCKLHI